jgi:hypothetical protein
MSIAATYVDATQFTAVYDAKGNTDLTGQCAVGTRIRANCGTDGYKYGVVSAVSYSSPTTTVTISGDTLTANLVNFDHGNDSPDTLANHGHTGQADGGTVAHSALTGAGTNTHAAIDTFLSSKAAASGLASLDSSSLVIQDPASATAVPAAGKIPKGDATYGLLDSWVRMGGECRLDYTSATLLTLSRYNGYRLIIDNAVCAIPAAGVTLAVTGLTALTLYYIYAAMSSGAMVLEASTTAYATDSRNGVRVKSGDTTRTLVGLAYPIAGPAWADSATQRFVLSWYNQKEKLAYRGSLGTLSTSSTSVTLLSSSYCEFLSWESKAVVGFVGAQALSSGSGSLGIGVNGTSSFTASFYFDGVGAFVSASVPIYYASVNIGYNFVSILGDVTGSSTLYVINASIIAFVWG